MTITIDIIAGARPNFMKIAPVIHALEARKNEGGRLHFRLVHTGQHYSSCMSDNFFDQLNIPLPDVNLEVGCGSPAAQTGAIMTGYESLLMEKTAALCLVVGDVTSTMACAIAAQKQHVPVAHVEAGIRSGDWSMPEEINRMVTDAVTNWFFTTSRIANTNLRQVGIPDKRIFFVGNTMIDTLQANINRLKPPRFWNEYGLKAGHYFVVTLHRPANVDNQDGLARLIRAIAENTRDLPVIFPVHPRTSRVLLQINALPDNICFTDPQPYLEFNYLVKHAKAVITDSGGITEETTVMGIPCLTIRDNTERPETVETGTSELLGTDPSALQPALERVFAGKWKKGAIPEKWDGAAGERIVAALEKLLVDQ